MAELLIYAPSGDPEQISLWVAENFESSQLTAMPTTYHDDPAVVSAYDLHRRPGGAELCVAVEAGKTVVLWPSVSAAFPSLPDLIDTLAAWSEQGVTILSPDAGGRPLDMAGRDGELIRWMAKFVNRKNPQRMANLAPATPKERTVAPYGFRWINDGSNTGKKTMHPDDAERADMRWVFDATEAGKSMDEIVATLREHKRKSRNGNPITARVVESYIQAEALLRALEGQAEIDYTSREFVLPTGELRRRQWPLPQKYAPRANPGDEVPGPDENAAHSD